MVSITYHDEGGLFTRASFLCQLVLVTYLKYCCSKLHENCNRERKEISSNLGEITLVNLPLQKFHL